MEDDLNFLKMIDNLFFITLLLRNLTNCNKTFNYVYINLEKLVSEIYYLQIVTDRGTFNKNIIKE